MMPEDTRHWYKNPLTNWNNRRPQSKFHFDRFADDSAADIRRNFLQFRGDWQDEVDNNAYDSPVQQDLNNLLTAGCVAESLELKLDFVKCLSPRQVITKETHPKLWQMVEATGLDNVYAQIQCQQPGEINWLHIDVLTRPKDRHLIASYDQVAADEDSIRMFVALEDWCWGHFWLVGNEIWKQWRAGDTLWYRWQDWPHATANSGHFRRPMLKITGQRTAKWDEVINRKNHVVDIK